MPNSSADFILRRKGKRKGVGLDPAAGFLHTLRPGRPALALDLMEELRAPICDRLAIAMINRGANYC